MANKDSKGRFTKSRDGQAADRLIGVDISVEEAVSDDALNLIDILEKGGFETAFDVARPIVTRIPPNFRLVLCDVGPHKLVRVMVRPNNSFYIPRMVIPMDVDLTNFDPTKLLIYNGNPPIRKGQW